MRISDANKLVGTIIKVKTWAGYDRSHSDIGVQAVTATITSGAAHDMKLKEGEQIFAVFNSSMYP